MMRIMTRLHSVPIILDGLREHQCTGLGTIEQVGRSGVAMENVDSKTVWQSRLRKMRAY